MHFATPGQVGPRPRSFWLLALLVTSLAQTTPMRAQDLAPSIDLPDLTPPTVARKDPPAIRWWHGAIAAGGISALMLLDHPIRHFTQENRSTGSDQVASTVRHFGQPEIYGTVTLGVLGAGALTHNPALTRVGGRLAATLAVAATLATAGKVMAGRPRPDASSDADGFVPFSGQSAMPSGHTAMAFAFATSLADDIHNPWASVGLYTAAAGVGWSRLNDNRHWLSDVAAGALLGIGSAKLASGRWRIFHLHPPSVLASPSGLGLGWNLQF